MTDICDDNGQAFLRPEEQEKYMCNFFMGIYKKNEKECDDLSGCIEDFLGPDILSNPIVKNSVLNEAERLFLERPFLISELDNAMKEANIKSAPGVDGFSMSFVSKF